MDIKDYNSISEIAAYRAKTSPDAIAYTFLEKGLDKEIHLTYKDLHDSATSIANNLLTKFKKRDRIVLFFPSGFDFIKSFFGCLYAGMIAVPSYPPKMNRSADRMKGILKDSVPSGILTNSSLGYERVMEKIENFTFPILYVDQLENAPTNIKLPKNKKKDIAFLQYTSGSTGIPKGVIISHENIMDNQKLIKDIFQLNQTSVLVGWLPFYHDMGLVGNILQTVYSGFRSVLFAPVQFLRSPELWLQAISKYKATVSGGPNFGYELCYEKIEYSHLKNLELSSWKVAFNGAEPISIETIDKFSNKFKICGFNKNSFLPCYGMAETTLLVSGIHAKEPIKTTTFLESELQFNGIKEEDATKSFNLVSCGEVAKGFEIKIINLEGDEVDDATVGEICLQGKSVSKGYWQSKNSNDFLCKIKGIETVFFRTGDLGLLKNSHLYVTGRLKDILIINGKNYYPQDIEATVERSHHGIISNGIAVFSINESITDKVVVIAECKLGSDVDTFEVIDGIRRDIFETYSISVYDIMLIRKGSILKTSSGKIQRTACKQVYLNREFRKINSFLDKKQLREVTTKSKTELSNTEKKLLNFFQLELNQQHFIDVNKNMFEYGLDSILLTRLVFFIEEDFDKEVSLEEVYKHASISELASLIELQENNTKVSVIEGKSEKVKQKASYLQQSIWINQQRDISNSGYNIPIVLEFDKFISSERVKEALKYLGTKYDTLRTVFQFENECVYQIIEDNFEFEFETHLIDTIIEQKEYIKKFTRNSFSLDKGPLLRATCINNKKGDSLLIIVVHHILLDATSVMLLVEEFKTIYNSLEKDKNSFKNKIEKKNLFIDFCNEEFNIDESVRKEQQVFWDTYLTPIPKRLALPKSTQYNSDTTAESVLLSIDPDESVKIQEYVKNEKINLFALLLSSYYILLNLISGNESIVIGTPVSLRTKKKFQNAIGLFINSVMLKATVKKEESFSSFIKRIYNDTREVFQHGSYPFQKIVENANVGIDENRLGITSIFFNYFDNQEDTIENSFESIYGSNPGVDLNFDLNLYVLPSDSKITFRLDYKKGDFSKASIQNVIFCYKNIIKEIVRNSNTTIGSKNYNSFIKKGTFEIINHKLFTNNDRDKLVWEKFENIVDLNFDKIAISGIDKEYSYREVYQLSKKISYSITEILPSNKSENIGLCFGHHEHMIFSMLSVLKTGNAYVPVDLTLPKERQEYFIKDAAIRVVLTNRLNYKEVQQLIKVLDTTVKIIVIDQLESSTGLKIKKDTFISSDSRAYILYTSGSTGKPKGVIHSQQYIMYIAYSFINSLKITSEDCISLIPTFNFSASMMDVFGALLSGASLKLIDIKSNGLGSLIDIIANSKITIYHSVPTIFRGLVNELPKINRHRELLDTVRIIYLAGEPLLKEDVESYQRLFNDDCIMVNGLGCTEFNICSQYFIDKTTKIASPYVPLGYDGIDVSVVLLDENKVPVRELVTGQIALKSKYLSKGYWKLPELTKECFVKIGEESYYLTGDLGRRLPDGRLIHLGRKDFQVKLRGQRIELGEIESQIIKIEGVNNVVVVLKNILDTSELCVYYTSKTLLDRNQVIKNLASFLPSYMIPKYYERLEVFPLTTSGKIDKRNLPKPVQHFVTKKNRNVIKKTEQEVQLSIIWSEVLNCDINAIERTSDFLLLGGSSLKALELINKILVEFQVKLTFSEIIQNLVLSEMNHMIQNKENTYIESIPNLTKIKEESSSPISISKKNKITL